VGAIDYLTDNLMARNKTQLLWRQLSFRDVQIGSAHATGAHS
jgi:hypothetical protein